MPSNSTPPLEVSPSVSYQAHLDFEQLRWSSTTSSASSHNESVERHRFLRTFRSHECTRSRPLLHRLVRAYRRRLAREAEAPRTVAGNPSRFYRRLREGADGAALHRSSRRLSLRGVIRR